MVIWGEMDGQRGAWLSHRGVRGGHASVYRLNISSGGGGLWRAWAPLEQPAPSPGVWA